MIMVHWPQIFMHVHLLSFMRSRLMAVIESSLINRFIFYVFAFLKWAEQFRFIGILHWYVGCWYPLHRHENNGTKNSSRKRLNIIFSSFFRRLRSMNNEGTSNDWNFHFNKEQQNQQHENASLFCYWWDWIIIINSVFSSILIRTYFFYVYNTITCHCMPLHATIVIEFGWKVLRIILFRSPWNHFILKCKSNYYWLRDAFVSYKIKSHWIEWNVLKQQPKKNSSKCAYFFFVARMIHITTAKCIFNQIHGTSLH